MLLGDLHHQPDDAIFSHAESFVFFFFFYLLFWGFDPLGASGERVHESEDFETLTVWKFTLLSWSLAEDRILAGGVSFVAQG